MSMRLRLDLGLDFRCPKCDAEIGVEWDNDGGDVERGLHTETCPACFTVIRIEVSVNFTPWVKPTDREEVK